MKKRRIGQREKSRSCHLSFKDWRDQNTLGVAGKGLCASAVSSHLSPCTFRCPLVWTPTSRKSRDRARWCSPGGNHTDRDRITVPPWALIIGSLLAPKPQQRMQSFRVLLLQLLFLCPQGQRFELTVTAPLCCFKMSGSPQQPWAHASAQSLPGAGLQAAGCIWAPLQHQGSTGAWRWMCLNCFRLLSKK